MICGLLAWIRQELYVEATESEFIIWRKAQVREEAYVYMTGLALLLQKQNLMILIGMKSLRALIGSILQGLRLH